MGSPSPRMVSPGSGTGAPSPGSGAGSSVAGGSASFPRPVEDPAGSVFFGPPLPPHPTMSKHATTSSANSRVAVFTFVASHRDCPRFPSVRPRSLTLSAGGDALVWGSRSAERHHCGDGKQGLTQHGGRRRTTQGKRQPRGAGIVAGAANCRGEGSAGLGAEADAQGAAGAAPGPHSQGAELRLRFVWPGKRGDGPGGGNRAHGAAAEPARGKCAPCLGRHGTHGRTVVRGRRRDYPCHNQSHDARPPHCRTLSRSRRSPRRRATRHPRLRGTPCSTSGACRDAAHREAQAAYTGPQENVNPCFSLHFLL